MSGSLTELPPAPPELTGDVSDPNDLADVLRELSKAKQFAKETKEAIERLDRRAQQLLDYQGVDHWMISDPVDGEKKTAKIIAPEDPVYDVDKARDLLGQELLDKLLAPARISTEKWEHFCELGAEQGGVAMEVAAQIVTYRPKKRYVRFFKAD